MNYYRRSLYVSRDMVRVIGSYMHAVPRATDFLRMLLCELPLKRQHALTTH